MPATIPDLTDRDAWTDDALTGMLEAVRAEQQRRWTLDNAEAEAEKIATDYSDAATGEPALEWKPGTVIGPGRTVTEDGIEYRNTSGAWLSVPPSAYPLGYQRTQPVQNVLPFKAGEQVKAGDLRTYQGKTYQCLQPHTTADHWAPPLVPALWTLA